MTRCNSWLKEDILKLKELASAGSSMITPTIIYTLVLPYLELQYRGHIYVY